MRIPGLLASPIVGMVFGFALLAAAPGEPAFAQVQWLRGDANSDGWVDVSDGRFVKDYMFCGGEEPQCQKSVDADDSGTISISDCVHLVSYGMIPPPWPAPAPGWSPLSCTAYEPQAPTRIADVAFGFEGCPSEVTGRFVSFDAYVTLTTTGNSSAHGAEAWSMSLTADGGTIRSISVDGVIVSGLADEDGDPSTAMLPVSTSLDGIRVSGPCRKVSEAARLGAASSIVLSYQGELSKKLVLDREGAQRIARIIVEAEVPFSGDPVPLTLRFEDGFGFNDQRGFENVVTIDGASHVPTLGSCRVLLRPGDCNGNGVNDSIDVSSGTSSDCDSNGIPDECGPDCNQSGTPDQCDIQGGASTDANANGIPDECDAGPIIPILLGFDGYPEPLMGNPGEVKSFEIFATLTTTDNSLWSGPREWTISLTAHGAAIEEISVDGLHVRAVSDDDGDPFTPPGPYPSDLDLTGLGSSRRLPCRTGAISNVVLPRGISLQPRGTQRIARIKMSAVIPASQNASPIIVRYEDAFGDEQAPFLQCQVGNHVMISPMIPEILKFGSAAIGVRCEVAPGSGSDCDGDSVADECQLADNDCNENGIPDSCDIASGASADCNSNRIPDECDIQAKAPRFSPPGLFLVDSYDPSASAPYFPPPQGIAVGDFTGDGLPDIAVNETRFGGISIFPGSGEGAFGQKIKVPAGLPLGYESLISCLEACDLDGDGDLDLAGTAPHAGVLVFMQKGPGSFTAHKYPAGNWSVSLAAADLDGDGDIDLATADGGATTVSVLENRGGGIFSAPQAVNVGSTVPRSIVAADLDGDGDQDLATANIRSEGNSVVSVLRNSGSASFSRTDFPLGSHAETIEAADLDGDGDIDLACPASSVAFLWVLSNKGDGGFLPAVAVRLDSPAVSVAFADLDGDADIDLAALHQGGYFVLRNDGKGKFSKAFGACFEWSSVSLVAADLDGEGDSDLAFVSYPRCLGSPYPAYLSVLMNETPGRSKDIDGDGIPDECPVGGLQLPGDANQDANLDLSDAIWLLGHLFLGTAPTLPCEGGTASSPGPGALALVDFNGDEGIDLSDAVSVLSYLFLGGRPPALGTECVTIPGCPDRCTP